MILNVWWWDRQTPIFVWLNHHVWRVTSQLVVHITTHHHFYSTESNVLLPIFQHWQNVSNLSEAMPWININHTYSVVYYTHQNKDGNIMCFFGGGSLLYPQKMVKSGLVCGFLAGPIVLLTRDILPCFIFRSRGVGSSMALKACSEESR